MEISIRNIETQDIDAVIELMREFAKYENLSDYCTITSERLHRAMFTDRGNVEGLIAFDADRPIGYALFYRCFSSFRGQQGMYLEDIYVNAGYRGHSVGKDLLRSLARIAKTRGFERIDFMVLDWNTTAIDFYFRHGAVRNEEERHFKFDGEAFEKLSG